MPFAIAIIAGIAALATGISALVMHNSVSKSTSSSNILSEIGETKENFDKEIKTKLFLGTVTIIAYIQYREQMKKKQHEEMLQSIGGGVAASTALGTAATIKVAKDAIAELQTEQGQEIGSTTSQTTAVNTQENGYIDIFPKIQQQGPRIYDTPGGQIEGPLINIFPFIQPEPKVYETPKDNIDIPSINIFPEAKAKEMEESILWMGENRVSKAIPEKVVNDLANYESKRFTLGNEEFILDKSGMKHILERHHPEYWEGSVKSTQTFLDKDMSIDDITNTVSDVLKQNREKLIEKGTTGMYQVEGTVDGVDYVVGLNKGRVGQFYKK